MRDEPQQMEMKFVHEETDVKEEETERCPTCQQKLRKLNPHRMCAAKVRVLLDLALLEERRRRRYPNAKPWVYVQAGHRLILRKTDDSEVEELETAYRASCHAARLHWFGLTDYNGMRSGEWRVNERGYEFINGRLAVPTRIWCREGRVIERDAEMITITQVKGVALSAQYWDHYGEWQQYTSPAETLWD